MKKFMITVLALLVFLPSVVSARNYRLVNTKLYGGSLDDQGIDFIRLEDGGYAIAGLTYSTDIPGLTNLGEYDGLLFVVDSNYDVLWKTNIGGTKGDYCTDIIEYHGYLITTISSHSSQYTNNANPGMGVLRYNKDGSYIRGFSYHNSSPTKSFVYDDKVFFSYTKYDGSYIASFTDTNPELNDFDTKYKINSSNYFENYIFFPKGDNKFDIIGNSYGALNGNIGTNMGDQFVTITSHTFNNLSDVTIKPYGGTGYDAAFGAVEDDEYYYIAGTTNSTDFNGASTHGNYDVFLLKVRKDDKSVVWNKMFGGTERDTGGEIVNLPNGNMLINIMTSSNLPNHESQGYDIYLLEVDKDGNVVNEWFYGTQGLDSIRNLIVNPDGSLTLVGYTDAPTFNNVSNHGGADIFLTDAYPEYIVDISNTTHGTVTTDKENGILNEDITITTTPDEGYVLDSLIVVDKEGNIVTVTNNVFKIGNKDVTVYATFKPSLYKFEEKDLKYQNKAMSFTLDVSTSLISKIYMNDLELVSDNYTLEENTITLKNEYLTTLEDGVYTLKVEFKNGTFITTEISKEPEEKIVNPNTGLDITIVYVLPFILGILILLFKNKNKYTLFKRL